MGKILICTVGGSHQPVVKSILENKPSFVCFLCTGKDPATGSKGSEFHIHGKGNIISADSKDPTPTLPNIPTQVNLKTESYEVEIIPADDLDKSFSIIREKIANLKDRFKDQEIIADFTGGTKAMTAALVTAILESDDINLVFVTGNRPDLVRVRDGTEHSAPAAVEEIRLQRSMTPFLKAWQRFAYDEANEGLRQIIPPLKPGLRPKLFFARDFSEAFSAWDRFDHDQARKKFQTYQSQISRIWLDQYLFLNLLTEEKDGSKKDLARLIDLWLNAKRRAKQGRFDDAVARLYRLTEWTAQWLLSKYHGLETGDLNMEKIPDDLKSKIHRDYDGKMKAGLWAAWEMIGELIPGKPGEFFKSEGKNLLNHIKIRNNSILAHGFIPISKADWERINAWFEKFFFPVLEEEARKLKINSFPQLPIECSFPPSSDNV